MANAGGPLPSVLLLIFCEGKQCGRGLLTAQCSRCPIYFLVWKSVSPVEDGMRWAEPEAGKIASDVLVVTFSKPLENFFSFAFFFFLFHNTAVVGWLTWRSSSHLLSPQSEGAHSHPQANFTSSCLLYDIKPERNRTNRPGACDTFQYPKLENLPILPG